MVLASNKKKVNKESSIKRLFADFKYQLNANKGIKKALVIIPLLLFGVTQICTKQIIKGILLLVLEGLFIFYMVFSGINDLVCLINLKSATDPTRGSTTCIIFGLLAIFIIVLFIALYFYNLRNALENLKIVNSDNRPDTFLEELNSLINGKFYLLLIIVPIIGVLLFTVLPLVFMISIAFTSYEGASLFFTWDGINSFKNLILIESQFNTLLSITIWTLIWAFFATFTTYFGGMFLAMLINKKTIKWKGFFRTIFIITMATPQFVSLLVINQMFGQLGPVNQLLVEWQIVSEPINFWGDVNIARVMIILVNVWIGVPYLMVLTSGILMNIPEDLYESASVEGANKFQQFTKITMPYMLFMTTPLIITQFVGNINNFNVIYLLTEGKPYGLGLENAGGTDILITWLYKLNKQYRLYNMSSAIGIIIFLLSAGISLLVYRNTSSYKREGDFS